MRDIVKIRQHAHYLIALDERILEYLGAEPWGTAEEMASRQGFDASRDTIQERCRVLADIDFLAPAVNDPDPAMWELTTWGRLYLAGEVDAGLREPTKRALRG